MTQNNQLILDDRYALTEEVRKGGMSVITKAADLRSGQFVAVKTMLPGGDETRKQESMSREYRALEVLKHPNIVSLLDAGKTQQFGTYLVLEWLQGTLDDYVLSNGPLQWPACFERIARPLLEAVSFAHRKGWAHRDIKPKNILLTETGIPKITDYGIARLDSTPQLGLTFADFRSEPYTPQEADDGRYSFGRDCYSVAAVIVFCLTGKPLKTYLDLSGYLSDLDPVTCPKAVLESALSADPAARHPLASSLLGEVEQFERMRQKSIQAGLEVYLSLPATSLEIVGRQIGEQQRAQVEAYLLSELNEAPTINAFEVGGQVRYRLYGVTWVIEAIRASDPPPRLTVESAFRMWASELERIKQGASEIGIVFTFSTPRDWVAAGANLDELTARLAKDRAERERAAQKQQSEQVFRGWYNFLRARNDYELERERAVSFELVEYQGIRATLRTSVPLSEESIGQSRLIRIGLNRVVLCDVIDVRLDEVTITVTFGSADDIPRRGNL